MKLLVVGVALAVVWAVLGSTSTANATIHEIVAAYCSGGGVGVIGDDGHLEPPGVGKEPAFANPVEKSGAVEFPVVTDKPNVKFEEGSNIFALNNSNVSHPSAEHCRKNGLQ
jgi:hypothetical protein